MRPVGDSFVYVLGVVIVKPARLHEVRARARSLPVGRSERFHWRSESHDQRRRMVATIAELNLVTVACVRPSERRQTFERTRGLVLRDL
jgi:triosephosphate isomerase